MLEDGDAVELKTRVDREEALAFLGHRGQELGDLRERLERAACLCEKELVPRGVYREMDASEALALLPGLDIARHVGGCTRVVLLAVTLGTQSEMLLCRERALSATDGLLVDACASSLVEQAANVLDGHIVEEAAARGLAATTRFSPGYGDLPLSWPAGFSRRKWRRSPPWESAPRRPTFSFPPNPSRPSSACTPGEVSSGKERAAPLVLLPIHAPCVPKEGPAMATPRKLTVTDDRLAEALAGRALPAVRRRHGHACSGRWPPYHPRGAGPAEPHAS